MIPKVIHLCWLSGDPYPPEIQKCLDTWKEHLPDYEIWLWDTKRFDVDSTLWTRQAFEAKKYAFAADYIRLYALYNYGGIYLDSDVLVYKPFDPLLHLPYFIGCDQIGAFEAAVIGAEKGCPWVKDILDSYEGRSFLQPDGTMDLLTLPCRFRDVLTEKGYRFYQVKDWKKFDFDAINLSEKKMFVFDKMYFNGRNQVGVSPTGQSFSAHCYSASWNQHTMGGVSSESLSPIGFSTSPSSSGTGHGQETNTDGSRYPSKENGKSPKKVLLVFGTRPEAIKMAPLVKEFEKHPEDFKTIVCVTGQHREMLDQVLRIFDIRPDYDLNIMKQGQDLYDVTSKVLLGMRDVLKESRPDVVLVHGDTTTSTAAALSAFYQQIPVGHVEAGLRTHNMYSPWPEEMNRQLTARIATYDFSPTPLSRKNLLTENVPAERITVTGNTVIDALYWVVNKINTDKVLDARLEKELLSFGYDVSRLAHGRRMVLITGHRRENFGEGFVHMCKAIQTLNRKYPEVDFVYPMHLNPNVRKPIHEVFGNDLEHLGNMFFIEPLEYLSFVYLMEKSHIVLTDSGGIQEEAPGLGKPVLVMRDTTERPEAVEAGTVKLVGTDYEKIVSETSLLIDDEAAYNKMSKAVNPYGDGKACGRIVEALR